MSNEKTAVGVTSSSPSTPKTVPDDIAFWLGNKLLSSPGLTQADMIAFVRESRDRLRKRELMAKLRSETKNCNADCLPATRKRIRAILDDLDKLDAAK